MTDEDRGFKKIKKELEALEKLKLYIYIDDKATYPDGIKVDFIAMLMEYGSEEFDVHFPTRPFFSSTFEAYHNYFVAFFERKIKEVVTGKITAYKLYQSLGSEAVKKVKEMIMSGTWHELDKKTAKRKGSEQPLYDTGTLYRSVKYKIEEI